MGFLDTVTIPNQPKPTTENKLGGSGSFLASVVLPSNQEQATKIADYQLNAATLSRQADEASSLSGLFKSTMAGIWDTAKTYTVDSAKQAYSYEKNALLHPIENLKQTLSGFSDNVINSASQGFNLASDAGANMIQDYHNGTGSTAGDVANFARIASGVAGVLFSPVSGAMSSAEKIPVLRQVADIVNIPFTITGLAGSYASGKIFDVIPNTWLSPASKEILRGPIGDLSSLAAQVVLGGKIMGKISDLAQSGRPVTVAEAHQIVREVKAEHADLINDTGTSQPSFFNKVNMPVKSDLVDSTGKHDLRTAMTNLERAGYSKGQISAIMGELSVKNNTGRFTPKEIAEVANQMTPENSPALKSNATIKDRPARTAQTEIIPKTEIAPAVPNADGTIPVRKYSEPELMKPVGKGESQTSGLGSGVEADAVSKGIADSFGKLPEYQRMDMKEQAQLALDFINTDPQGALDVALGLRPSPRHDLLPESVYTAVRIMARNKGDVELMRQLATQSQIVSHATALGQRIKALDSGVTNDPVSVIQDIKAAREANIEKKKKGTLLTEKKKIAEEIKAEIKKEVSKRPSWEDFINEVQCKY